MNTQRPCQGNDPGKDSCNSLELLSLKEYATEGGLFRCEWGCADEMKGGNQIAQREVFVFLFPKSLKGQGLVVPLGEASLAASLLAMRHTGSIAQTETHRLFGLVPSPIHVAAL